MTESLRHIGRGAYDAVEKRGHRWLLADGGLVEDMTGGAFVQSLIGVPVPPSHMFANVHPPGGIETPACRRLEEEVLRRAGPSFGGILWGTSGSDAVEVAIWAVQQTLWGGTVGPETYVVRRGGYHGNTRLTRWLSTRGGVNDEGLFQANRVVIDEAGPTTTGSEQGDLLGSIQVAPLQGKAVMILETVATTGPSFWPGRAAYRELLRWCAQQGVPVILDEVASGVYRNGWFCASEWCGADAPAAITLSKSLTSGIYPLSCVILRCDVADALRQLPRTPAFTYGLTDPAAWIAQDSLRRFDDLVSMGTFHRRKRAVEDCVTRLAKAAGGIWVESTDTTVRVGLSDQDMAQVLKSEFAERGMMGYMTRAELVKRMIFAFCCPSLDLPDETVRRIYSQFCDAVECAAR